MRALLSLMMFFCACVPSVPDVSETPAATVSEDATAEAAVILDGDQAVVLLSVLDRGPVALDAERPARLMIGGETVEAPMLDMPSRRPVGDRTATGASYRIEAEVAREMARGADLDVELSIGGTYRRFRARRADILQ